MQGVLEQPPNIAAHVTDSEATIPTIDARVVGELGESIGGVGQLVADLAGVSAAGTTHGVVDDVVADRWEGRLVHRQRLLDAVGVQAGDVAAVDGVLDRRPCRRGGSRAQVAAGGGQLRLPPLPEAA